MKQMRRSYEDGGLDEAGLAGDWLAQFGAWFADASAAGLSEPNAMVLATVSADGRPSARTVLLKGVDMRGFVLYTNLDSRKGGELLANPHVSLVFLWHPLGRQVVVTGDAEAIGAEESDAYFSTRPYGSQIGAAASPQSQIIAGRAELERARDELVARHPEGTPVPRPAHWGGVRVAPDAVEFWQGRLDRLHDRLRFRREGDAWVVERLAP
jgi:pyridoxamine 5'-phosphate oxidase